jgi:hypothetical protein
MNGGSRCCTSTVASPMSDPRDRSFARALAGAAVAHLLAAVSLWGAGGLRDSSRPLAAPPAEPELEAISVTLDHGEERPSAAGARATATPPQKARSHARGLAGRVEVDREALEGSAAASAEATPPTSAAPFAAEPAPGPSVVPLSAEALGIGRTNPFLVRAEEPPRAAAKRRVEEALRAPARDRERALGLGPEGPVLRALDEATPRSTAPVRGRAVFLAVADDEGAVVRLEVLDCDGDRAGWADAARLASAALRGTKLRIPKSTRRAEMRIEVTSTWKLPGGQEPGTDVTLFRVPLAKGEGKSSSKVSLLDPIPKLRVVEVPLPDGRTMPIPSIQIDLFRAAVDPANAGAQPRRVVHAHLLSSSFI